MNKKLMLLSFLLVPVLFADTVEYTGIRPVKLQRSRKMIGRVVYDNSRKSYVSYAFLPFAVPEKHFAALRKFFLKLNQAKLGTPGTFYLDEKSGECGYKVISPDGSWQKGNFYSLYPELRGIICFNDVYRAWERVKMFPLSQRTHGDLEKMSAPQVADGAAANADGSSASASEEITAAKAEEKGIKPDAAQIGREFAGLLRESSFKYRKALSDAVQRRDFRSIDRIARQAYADGLPEAGTCAGYAVLHGKFAHSAMIAGEMARAESEPYGKMAALAIWYFTKAVEWADLPEAHYELAWMLERRIDSDRAGFFRHYKLAMDKGHLPAAVEVARCMWFGIGTKADRQKAEAIAAAHLKRYPDCSMGKLFAGLGLMRQKERRSEGWQLIEEAAKKIDLAAWVAGCINEFGLFGSPQVIGYADNFGVFPGDGGSTRYYELNDIWMKRSQFHNLNIVTWGDRGSLDLKNGK